MYQLTSALVGWNHSSPWKRIGDFAASIPPKPTKIAMPTNRKFQALIRSAFPRMYGMRMRPPVTTSTRVPNNASGSQFCMRYFSQSKRHAANQSKEDTEHFGKSRYAFTNALTA